MARKKKETESSTALEYLILEPKESYACGLSDAWHYTLDTDAEEQAKRWIGPYLSREAVDAAVQKAIEEAAVATVAAALGGEA